MPRSRHAAVADEGNQDQGRRRHDPSRLLTLPLNSTGKKVPTIIYPHGGPHARDSWGFDPIVQFMASRGLRWAGELPRSTGYGNDWYEAGLRNWGTVMVDDVISSTKWAISEGIADPAHLHRRLEFWRLRGADERGARARPVSLRCEHRRCFGSAPARRRVEGILRRRRLGGIALGDDTSELKAGSPSKNAAKSRRRCC